MTRGASGSTGSALTFLGEGLEQLPTGSGESRADAVFWNLEPLGDFPIGATVEVVFLHDAAFEVVESGQECRDLLGILEMVLERIGSWVG